MDSILPNHPPYWPRMFQKVTVVFGDPIPIDAKLKELQERNVGREELHHELTSVVQTYLYKLKDISQTLHESHMANSLFQRKLPLKMLWVWEWQSLSFSENGCDIFTIHSANNQTMTSVYGHYKVSNVFKCTKMSFKQTEITKKYIEWLISLIFIVKNNYNIFEEMS